MAIPMIKPKENADTSVDRLTTTPPRTLLLDNLSRQSSIITAIFTLLASPNPNAISTSTLASLPADVQSALSSSSSSSSKSLLIPSNPSSSSLTNPIQHHPIDILYSALHTSSAEMHTIRKRLSEHQRIWACLEAKKREVQSLERRVRGLIVEMERGRGELEEMVVEGRKVVKGIEGIEAAPLPASSLLAHAHALARHSSAPLSSLLTPIDRAAYMPWPTEGAMRTGLLFQMQGSMSGIGEVGTMGMANGGDVEMADGNAATEAAGMAAAEVHREEYGRRYDPDAVYNLELNSDSEDD